MCWVTIFWKTMLNIALSLIRTMLCVFVSKLNLCCCNWRERIHSWICSFVLTGIICGQGCRVVLRWISRGFRWHVYCTPVVPELLLNRASFVEPVPAESHFSQHAPARTDKWIQSHTSPPGLRPAQTHDTYYKSNTTATPSTLPSFLSSHTCPLRWVMFTVASIFYYLFIWIDL